jgi:uncharacterized repeat protein (TIGR01451 family)
MRIRKTFLFKYLLPACLALLLSACGGGGGSGGGVTGGSSGLALNITDAPVVDEDISEVWVRFTQVILHPADGSGDIVYDVTDDTDPNDIKPYRDIELKSLVGGKTMLLGEIPLDAGDYSWIRLVIDPANTHIVETGGGDYLVKCPSCTQSGFKLNRSFTIEANGWINFTIDFDLRKSITLSQPNKSPREDFDYILRPTLRILETELASSYIYGEVTDLRSEQTNPDAPDGCWVYVYDGEMASITPDDICLNTAPAVCKPADRPLLETPVVYDGSDGSYDYNTGYIYPGTYTIALVCEADDPDLDEDLLFISETEVMAAAVPGGALQDLDLVDTAQLSFYKTLLDNADQDASGTVTPGDTLTYQFVASNTGNTDLTGVSISDMMPGLSALACDIALPAALMPADAATCTATYDVQPADTVISNTATADSDQTDEISSTLDVTVDNP